MVLSNAIKPGAVDNSVSTYTEHWIEKEGGNTSQEEKFGYSGFSNLSNMCKCRDTVFGNGFFDSEVMTYFGGEIWYKRAS
jgi:hypothetical protein